MTPRYYQTAANDAVWEFLANKQGNPLIVLPTGAGKSLVIAMLCKQAVEFGGRVVVLQHRKELIQQKEEWFRCLHTRKHTNCYGIRSTVPKPGPRIRGFG